MKDKGIIFSAPMVKALLAGTKTQTRRILSPQPVEHEGMNCRRLAFYNHKGVQIGDASPDLLSDGSCPAAMFTPYAGVDRLYVREGWKVSSAQDDLAPRNLPSDLTVEFLADGPGYFDGKGRPSIFMPRWASRLWLLVKDVRVERLQSISEADAQAEGLTAFPCEGPFRGPDATYWTVARGDGNSRSDPVSAYAALWDSLHTELGQRWEDNPWVVAVSFDVHRGNIDREAG